MIPTAPHALPDDHVQLLEGAHELHPEHTFRHQAADAVVLQDPVTKQFLHVPHDKIRQHQGRLSKSTTHADLARENAELRQQLAQLISAQGARSPSPATEDEKTALAAGA